jgi:hypothetical protein
MPSPRDLAFTGLRRRRGARGQQGLRPAGPAATRVCGQQGLRPAGPAGQEPAQVRGLRRGHPVNIMAAAGEPGRSVRTPPPAASPAAPRPTRPAPLTSATSRRHARRPAERRLTVLSAKLPVLEPGRRVVVNSGHGRGLPCAPCLWRELVGRRGDAPTASRILRAERPRLRAATSPDRAFRRPRRAAVRSLRAPLYHTQRRLPQYGGRARLRSCQWHFPAPFSVGPYPWMFRQNSEQVT